MNNIKENKIFNILLKVLYYIVVVFVCIIGLLLLFYIVTSQIHQNDENYRPKISIYTIVSPSMTPAINVYDVVINVREDKPEDIQIGDIITYISQAPNSEGMTITHRVVEIAELPDGEFEYMTQGDNNDTPDSLYVMHDQVIGKKVFIIPKVGKLQFLIANKKGWLFLLLIPVGIYVFTDMYKLYKLLKLKNKVDEVTKEEPIEDKTEIENQRKEEIKERLEQKEVVPIIEEVEVPKITRPKRKEPFLEKYEETILEVTKKEPEPTPVVEEIESLDIDDQLFDPLNKFIDEQVVEEPKKEEPIKEEPKPKKAPKVTNEYFEILDTDELSSKIKEYDSKIAKLDKMLKDMDKLNKQSEIKKQEEKIEDIIETDFLKGNRIKVVSEIETKNKKRSSSTTKSTSTPKETKKSISELTKAVESKKVAVNLRPVVEEQITKKETEKKTKPRLNLDPKEIKKVKRSSVKKDKLPIDELIEEQNNKPKKTTKKPKKKLITIEKVRK